MGVGGGLLFYINENIPNSIVNDEHCKWYWNDFFEFWVKTRKWLCVGTKNENYILDKFSKVLSNLACQYDVMLIAGFNC